VSASGTKPCNLHCMEFIMSACTTVHKGTVNIDNMENLEMSGEV